MQADPTQHKHIYWRSRRGMLELELKLVPFVRDCFAQLTAKEQITYETILAEEDWQIFDWLQKKEVPRDESVEALINKIVQYRGCL